MFRTTFLALTALRMLNAAGQGSCAEPNDDFADSSILPMGEYDCALDFWGDNDYFIIQTTDCNVLTIHVDGFSGSADFTIKLYTAPNLNALFAEANSGTEYEVTLSVPVETDNLYLRLYSSTQQEPNYHLSMALSPQPVPVLTASGDLSLCPGESVVLYTDIPGDNTWIDGSHADSLVVTTPGVYQVTHAYPNCHPGSVPVTVTMDPLPLAGFLYELSGDTVAFTSTDTGATSWAWDFAGLGTSTEESPTFIFPAQSVYDVVLHVEGPCGSDSITQQVDYNVGLAEPEHAASARIQPNPCTQCIVNGISTARGLAVVDALGRSVATRFVPCADGFSIAVADHARGLLTLIGPKGEHIRFVRE